MDLRQRCKDAELKVERLRRENKKLRTALEFYANKDNYGSDDTSRATGNKCFDIVLFDFERGEKEDYAGRRARIALALRIQESDK